MEKEDALKMLIDGEFVRVKFEEELTKEKDITVFAKSNDDGSEDGLDNQASLNNQASSDALNSVTDTNTFSQTRSVGSIEVYREEGNELIAIINNIFYENWYKTYLSGLEDGESYDTFDLKILGDLGLDYVVDPNPNVVWNISIF